MKTYRILLCLLSLLLAGCDIVKVDIDENRRVLEAEGGTFTVEVFSTGLDKVSFDFNGGQQWITVDTIDGFSSTCFGQPIVSYTRALAEGSDVITLHAEPNTTGKRRSATLYVSSFNLEDHIKIIQKAQ